jgi:hypothetical protein
MLGRFVLKTVPLCIANALRDLPYVSNRNMSSGERRPLVGHGPKRVVQETRKEQRKDEAASVVPDHMKRFAEFFERSDDEKLELFMTLHNRQFVVERRAVLEYGPFLSKLELSSVLPSFEGVSKESPVATEKTKKKSKSAVGLQDAKSSAKAPRRKSPPS